MPTSDQIRITAEAATPLIARIWRALQPLRSVVGFMNTGAHPDDEISGMLATLGLRDGVNLSYACANRGEGGQNDIGTEAGFDLGTIRTAEMERAADMLDMRLYWLGQSPEDTITDFGFSKSGEETMGHWGRDRTLQRFVGIVRMERPDILCPTFLDIPGQHGHHRAMTAAAHEVMELAADPGFDGCDLPVWQVAKLYLPAWSGAGGAYDDEVPPPPATVVVAGRGSDPVLGVSHARIGQQSRAFHRTQGMGHWVQSGTETDWPLHLARSRVGADRGAVTDNLPGDLQDIDPALGPAQAAIAEAIAAFPDRAGMLNAATRAFAALPAVHVDPDHAHRITRKQAQLARVIRFCAHPDARARAAKTLLIPGEETALTVEQRIPDFGTARIGFTLPDEMAVSAGTLRVAETAPASDPYPDMYDPLAPRAPALAVTITAEGVAATSHIPFETPPLIAPATRARLSQSDAILNLAGPGREIALTVSDISGGTAGFDLPGGWQQDWSGAHVTLTPPGDVAEGLYHLPLLLDGTAAQNLRVFTRDHIAPRLRSTPAMLTLRVTTIALPQARIAYIGAGNDQAATWLAAIGCDVTVLDDAALSSVDPFAGFDTVLIGVFAMRFRPALLPLIPALQGWVRAGGNLVTLYHRPWDNWSPETTPPARLEIGQPSLRWRVTDETAEVTHLAPDHPILTGPNPIGPGDWQGWHKERGLYFAKSWDPAYTPLLAMSDPGDPP
ncbi:PIG-L family deacetylase [Rhodophyticola sp. CCM32]|uniref:PIG-L family deacetylase n=1 Tax=Rhodophyticola sp. CCM32 TaxID=2916397 RepID=UPI001EE59D02|nr:PIG-L family deacetylase [Rhodophyticola sp. CCM32]